MTQQKMTQQQRNALQPFAIVIAGIDAALEEMTEGEIEELFEACEATNERNCWYATYRAAQYLLPKLQSRVEKIQKESTGDE